MLSKRFFLHSVLGTVYGRRQAPQRGDRRATQRGLLKEFRSAAEALEDRWLLSANPVAQTALNPVAQTALNRVAHTTYVILDKQPDLKSAQLVSNFDSPITPTEMEAAYGISSLNIGAISSLGKGQTIALIDAYNDPDIISDANYFSSYYGLPQFNVAGGPTLQVLNENGGTNLSGIQNASASGWDVEESLDVEWAHSMAPGANIILFEATTQSLSDLFTAEVTAAKTAGVSAVSNSWGTSEFQGEQQDDSYFLTPAGHQGVTFMASTGDSGPPVGYPAASPNVVAVGGTSLYANTPGAYLGESVWGNEDFDGAGSGGVSQYELQPSYQTGKVNGTSSKYRTTPDVALDADPITGVYVYDTDSVGGFLQVGGTSLSSPLMSGIIAIANEVRVSNGLTTLNGATQTLPMLYSVPQDSIFHDITTGISNSVNYGVSNNNGFAAAPGYDLATGLGSPIGNDLVAYLGGDNTNPTPTVSAPIDSTDPENGVDTWNNVISVNDQSSSTKQQLTLTADEGTIHLGSTSGLTISGSNGSSSMTLTGTLANLNAALSNVAYTPAANYLGNDFIQISLNDGSDTNTGWGAINMTIIPASGPIIGSGALSVSTTINQPYNFLSGLLLADPDASGNSDSLSLNVDNGTLALASTTGLTFTSGSNDSSSMTIQGTLAQLQDALYSFGSNGLVYTPNNDFVGTDWLQLSVTNSVDSLTDPAVVPIYVNGAPAVSAPKNVQVVENNSYTFPANSITLSDLGASGSSDSLTLSVSDGVVNLESTTGLTFSQGASGSSTMTFSGPFNDLQAAVSGLTYVPNNDFLGTDTLSLTLSDAGDQLSSGKISVGISVVAQPSLAVPSSVSVAENGTYTFSPGALSLADASATGTSNTLELKVGDGKLNLGSTSGLTFTNGSNGSSSMTVAGSISNLAAALNDLVYTPTANWSGSDTLTLSYTDSNDGLNVSKTVPIIVSSLLPPTVTAPTSVTTDENQSYTFSGASISVIDPVAVGTSDSVTLTVNDGELTLAPDSGVTVTSGSNGSASMIINGTLADLNAALNGLVYAPNSGYSGSDSLSITVNDSGDALSGPGKVQITVNGAPAVTAPATADVNENGSYTFASGAISLADAAASGTSDSLTLSVAEGTLTLGSTTGLTFSTGSNGSSSITVSGTLANLNAAVSGLTYTPNSNYTGDDSIQFKLADSIDSLSGPAAISITVGNFPPPSFTAPLTASTNENGSITFPGTISVTDTVASGASDSLTLSVASGKLTLGSTSGLTITSGSNNSASMTVTGTLANLNAALIDLVYAPNSGFSGHDSLKISVIDSSDNQPGSATVAIAVNPFVTAPATASVLENGAYAFSSSASDQITLTDGAASATSESLTLTVLHGKLTLASTTGLTFSSGSNDSSSMTVKGSLANLTAALNGLEYAPQTSYTGSDTLTISVGDSVDGLSGSASVAITVAFKKILSPGPAAVDADVMVGDQDQQDQEAVQWAGVTAAVDVLND